MYLNSKYYNQLIIIFYSKLCSMDFNKLLQYNFEFNNLLDKHVLFK